MPTAQCSSATAKLTGCESFADLSLLSQRAQIGTGMNRAILCMIACLFAGCATFNESELAYLRGRNLPPSVLAKLERGGFLTPPDIITLTNRGVPDRFIVRHLEDNGVNYLVNRSDVTRMRKAGVSALVIDVLIEQCERFARSYAAPPVDVDADFWWADSPYFGRDLYYPYW